MAAPDNSAKIPIGAVLLGKYRITREIGRGGMAAVFEAMQLALGKKVALKVLAAELTTSSVVIERFFREARAAASIKSPYIVDVYDSGRLDDGRPFIAMELLEGESLYDRMARVRRLGPEETVRIIGQCAKGLMKAHAAGIVHRDLKPENIFLVYAEDGEQVAKLLDFGLAKFYSPVTADEETVRLTREGAVFGTPAYMSPEQVKGHGSLDHRADLWALGCMAFECLIGRPVWNTDQGVAMTFAAIASATPPVPSELRPDLPPAFDAWFRRSVERDPELRFQSAAELAEALARALNSSSYRGLPSFADAAVLAPARVGAEPASSSLEETRVFEDVEPPTIPAARTATASSVSSQRDHLLPPRPTRDFGLSATDLAPMASPGSGPPPFQPRSGVGRHVLSLVGLTLASGVAYLTWADMLRPQVYTPVVRAAGGHVPLAEPAHAREVEAAGADEPKWVAAVVDGQKLLTQGKVDDALRRWKDAQDLGGSAVGRSLTEHVRAAMATPSPCKLAALAHPRMGVGAGSAVRPTVAAGPKGAVVAWTDDHEQAGHDHVYSVMLDPAARPGTRPRDLTPEGNDVARPTLHAVSDRMVLLYTDRGGREPGVRVRWLDDQGRISGASMLVGAGRSGSFWPAIEKVPDGFVVAWQDDRDKDGDDLFLRRLGTGLEPLGQEIRATDYAPLRAVPTHVRVPSIAFAHQSIFIAYRLERGSSHLIVRQHLPLTTPELSAAGLPDNRAAGANRKDRSLGEAIVVNTDRIPADAPDMACGKEGCFLVWHSEQSGAYVAMLEPVQGHVVWRKKFAQAGGRPALAVSRDGEVMTAYYDAGRVKLATLSRDGVGPTSVIGKVSGDQPRPSVASAGGADWLVAWQDHEGARSEPFVARVTCHSP